MENCMSACSQTRRAMNMWHGKSFSHQEALGTLSAIELPIPRQEKVTVQGLTVGPLTLRWESGVLTVKTPTERHVLTRSQGAELLSYLHELRGSLLKRSDR